MAGEVREVEPFLRAGGVVVFDPEPSRESGPRFRTFIRGWDKPAHIILDRPREKDRLAPMRDGMPCVIRMLQDGVACAFSSVVMDCTNKDDPTARR